jgi:glutamate racemase
MKRSTAAAILSLMAMLLISSFAAPTGQESPAPRAGLDRFFRKKSVTIAVTDSGLGGLSVLADAASRMKRAGTFERVDFLFFNALFSAEGGYNSLAHREQKIAIFESALESLQMKFHPDLVLIACNTLSVLFGDTPFARRARIPVVGIIDAGVKMTAEALRSHPGSAVIIFATPTTISEGTHVKEIMKAGVAAGRIITQACPELESYIEKDCASEETGMLISAFVDEALRKLPASPPPVFASLNCSHYGYSLPLWESAFAEAGVTPLAILNPNFRMADFLFAPGRAGRYSMTAVTARVVSMVEISPAKINSLGRWLSRISPETARALAAYELAPDLIGLDHSKAQKTSEK